MAVEFQNPVRFLDTKSLITNLIITTLTVAVSVIALIATTNFTGPLPVSINQTTTEKASAFDVTGESEIATSPDEAQVSLGITVDGFTVADTQDQANQIINNVNQAVRNLGVDREDISTQQYSINPRYDFSEPGNQRITGYSVNTSLLVKVTDFDQLNQIIDAATAQGANQVGGISFSVSEEKEREIRKQAREEAIADAKQSAKELANLADMKLGRVINVYESQLGQPQPVYRALEADLAVSNEAAPTQIEPGSTTLRYSVTLSFETL